MKKYLFLAAAALSFAACSNDSVLNYGEATQNSEGQIPLNFGIVSNSNENSTITRSNYITTGNTALQTNVGLYVYITGKTAVYNTYGFANIQGTIGTLTSTTFQLSSTSYTKDCTPVSAASTISFPDNKATAVDIYAYAPFHALTTSSGDAPADLSGTPTITITTTADQSSSYANDDYLWGSITDGSSITATNYLAAKTSSSAASKDYFSTTGQVVVPMDHKLSKICVNLIPSGMDISKLQGATVKIYPDYTQGTLNLQTGAVATDNSTGYDAANGNAITLTTTLGTDGSTEITAGNDGHPDDLVYTGDAQSGSLEGYSACGIIIPQGLTTAHKFIEVILADGSTTTTYTWTPSAAATFLTGNIYTFNIKVTAQGLNVTTLVNDWSSDSWGTTTTPQEGTADLQ